MKLIDILARDLDVWPEGLECLSQLKGTGYIINGKGFDGRAFDALEIADETNIAGAIVTRSEWQAAVDELKAGAWTGTGLPPVGAVCELWYSCNEWAPCTVMAHDVSMGIPIAVVRHGEQCYTGSSAKTLRPIRTPEQIAAEVREKAIAAMCNVFMRSKEEGIRVMDCCARLYDAGYRKFEIVEGE